jgi:predicted branched-subunit amino acid permease
VSAGGFFGGSRAALPVVLGYLSIGFAAGVVQRAAGLSVAEVMLLSLLLYAGSAQVVVASLIATAVSPFAAGLGAGAALPQFPGVAERADRRAAHR